MPSKPDTWMPLYIGDYLKDTGGLTTIQHGAYLLMIMHYWCTGPLMDDDRNLSTICKVSRTIWRREIAPFVRPFFQVSDGRLYHKRIEAERAHTMEVSAKRRAAAFVKHGKGLGGGGGGGTVAPRAANAPLSTRLNGSLWDANAPANAPSKKDANAPRRWDANADEAGMQMHVQSQSQKKEEESLSQTQYSECAREERAREVQPGGEPYPGSLPPDPIPEPAPKPPPSVPPLRGHMPCRSSPPQRWIALAGDDAITDDGRRGGQVAGYFLHQIAELVCQAARIEDADWRCDWRPLKAWLADGLDPQTIIAAVEWVARQADYEPPRSLMRFDGVVRRWRQERQA